MAIFFENDPGFFDIGPAARKESQEKAHRIGAKLPIFAMGADPDGDEVPLTSLLYLPPNTTLPRHAHDCYRVEVVMKGSIDTGTRVLGPGAVMTSSPGEFYGPHTSGSEGSVTVEIFSRAKGITAQLETGN
jgi:hypothetical protein